MGSSILRSIATAFWLSNGGVTPGVGVKPETIHAQMISTPLLSANALSAERGLRTLFAGVSLTLGSGQIMYLRGPNGAGKTTLLRTLAGLSQPESGGITRAGRVQYWGHTAAVKDELTAGENLKLLCASESIPDAHYEVALARCGLAARRDVIARKLSAGQRRRIGMSWLMLSSAKVWLLDEPTTALDTAGLALLAEVLNGHVGAGGAAIIATHHTIAGLEAATHTLELSA